MSVIRCQRSDRKVALVLAAVLSYLPFCATAGGFDPDAYESEIRKQAHMPDDWLACHADKDCVIATVPCQTGISVGRAHKLDAEGAVCHAEDCNAMCDRTLIARSYAACQDDACVLKLGNRPLPKPDDTKPDAKKPAGQKTSAGDDEIIDPKDFP